YTWNAPSLFDSAEDWESAFEHVLTALAGFGRFQGHLGDGPATLLEALEARDDLTRQVGKVVVYARLSHAVDTGDQPAFGMYGKAQGLYGQALAAVAFVEPELLAIGEETLRRWLEEPRLRVYDHYINDLLRKQAHVRSAEVEELLGMVEDPFGGAFATASVLTNADFQFRPAIASDGSELPVTQGAIGKILNGADRQARRTAWESYADAHLAFRNTLASSLTTAIKQDVFRMRARRHGSSLEAALFASNIPVEVFHNLIDTYHRHLPTWHRYWALRRKALRVETLHPYDIWAPLTKDSPRVTYEQAVNWISEGLAPLGDEYVSVLRRGCLEDRWVDVFPNQGKRSGAFSSGSPGTHPFIVMSYTDDLLSLSTLAHELGHSMHSYLSWKHQPVVYGRYSLFAAEVASNFHQAMVRAHLMKTNSDPAFLISLIEEAMSNFHRYFFIMPTLARFEHEVHQRVEHGQSLTPDDLTELMADLFSEAYGDEMYVDRERVGITWATFQHLYMNHYVYQYATGISGAHALAGRILSGEPGAAEDYLGFLKAGGSEYPLDALKGAGVDLATPQPVEETFRVLAGMVDKLEELVG
ncbi:MAG: oligoendopeptidase F, partial [Anaerolineae bacterium]